ncbi:MULTISPECIES: protein translocase subunit SecF [unclassified Oceanobacter]|jgi:preprotein translocase subunit SecF|uniref:protein translocase subunit SecF n=1 Tax=unclassified Oceanobacter TaxID=2620260 RepID=UPI0026E13215|nr:MULTISPECIES: protein translocase subunit SecF [unclassified Oceanobacter]MDO6683545.1 protein translocase subunit SecF [Oceanobacter sp. 5_MG-2023]MDP2607525.1 protein translocase subunit SecF [Oceanobacter sp. 1_MG-2023]MDP2610793.1 protein translocase subunit SecF [Oceanobacter sp. 2_MG-2023]
MKKSFDFMRLRMGAMVLSGLLLVVSIGSLAVQGLNFGLDFTGGTLLEVQYATPQPLDDISAALDEAGYSGVTVQNFGSETDILVRMSEAFRDNLGNEVLDILQASAEGNSLTLKRSEFVGANVGEELRDQGGLALLLALTVVMIYVAARFQFKFSVGAVFALFHDVMIILGLFSLFQWEFDLTVLAAVLAVIGYSLNDTIVVADRIRENFRILRRSDALGIMNESLNQTLDRTLMTSITTALVLLALLVVGGELIHNFALALMIGVLVGTYSSIYVAVNILVLMKLSREDLIPPETEEEVDDRP